MEPSIAETMYQIFRQANMDLLDGLDEAQKRFVWTDMLGWNADTPVQYPLAFTQAYAWPAGEDNPPPGSSMSQTPHLLHVFGNYKQTRTVYTIDRTLLHHLVDMKWPKKIRLEAAALPKNGCVLDFPAHEAFGVENIQGNDRVQVICTYNLNAEGELEILLSALCLRWNAEGSRDLVTLGSLTAWLEMRSPTLEDAILNFVISIHDAYEAGISEPTGLGEPFNKKQQANEDRPFTTNWQRYLKTVLTVLLYINGNNDLLELKQPPDPGSKNNARRRRLGKIQPLTETTVPPRHFLVGRTFASTIQRWDEQERADATKTGRSIRPHLRAAHAHKYWIGKGRTQQRVRFLMPVSVKCWTPPESLPARRLVK